jgi:hypothetical protein
MRAAVACSMTRAVVTFHRDQASQHAIVGTEHRELDLALLLVKG